MIIPHPGERAVKVQTSVQVDSIRFNCLHVSVFLALMTLSAPPPPSLPPLPRRSLGSSRYRRGRPPQALHSQDELREGLGSWLPPAEHQGDPLLDRDPSAQGAAVTGRGSAHHAHRRPTAPGLRLLLERAHTPCLASGCCFSVGCRGHKGAQTAVTLKTTPTKGVFWPSSFFFFPSSPPNNRTTIKRADVSEVNFAPFFRGSLACVVGWDELQCKKKSYWTTPAAQPQNHSPGTASRFMSNCRAEN